MNKKKLKYTYILRISIAIRCNVSKKTFFSMITLTAQPVNMTIIQIYAPTRDYDDEDIEIFNEEIEKRYFNYTR